MLEILNKLEKLASVLDKKGKHNLADEVESIMQNIVAANKKVVKTAEIHKMPSDQVPETNPGLHVDGDPYEYAYLEEMDAFVVTSPKGRGTIISSGGPYGSSWTELRTRLQRSDPGGASTMPLAIDETDVGYLQRRQDSRTRGMDPGGASAEEDALSRKMVRDSLNSNADDEEIKSEASQKMDLETVMSVAFSDPTRTPFRR